MKRESILIAALLSLSGCSGHGLQDWADKTFNNTPKGEERSEAVSDAPTVPPSQNEALQAVSPSQTATSEGGVMQKKLDTWVEKEWTPAVETNESIKAMNEDEERPFTLQEYVDKAAVYMENKPESDKPSHSQQLEELPVIGK